MLLLAAVDDGVVTYGFGLIAFLSERTDGELDLPEGTAYSALKRLLRAGYLSRVPQRVGGRVRQTYRLTDAGREALAERVEDWNRVRVTVSAVLGDRELRGRPPRGRRG